VLFLTQSFATIKVNMAKISILIALLVLALKSLAAYLTGSVALWSDAVESIVNVVTAIVTLLAVWYAEKPADRRHPYGHGKVEYFAAVFQGVMIIIAAISIFYAAWKAFTLPHTVLMPPVAFVILAIATGLNLFWARVLIKQPSPALQADGVHLMSDVWSTVGVIAGLIAAYALNIVQLDAIIAALVAFFILYSGFKVLDKSLNGLMDEAGEPHETIEILSIINNTLDGAIEAHDLRHRKSGRKTFIEFHLVVSGAMSVSSSHEICDRLELALRNIHHDALITIHVEPEHKAKH
jgi:cation diffusion facilitator family transporter